MYKLEPLLIAQSIMALQSYMNDLLRSYGRPDVCIVEDNAVLPFQETARRTYDRRTLICRSQSLDLDLNETTKRRSLFSKQSTGETRPCISACRWSDMFHQKSDPALQMPHRTDDRWVVSRHSSDSSLLKPKRTMCMPEPCSILCNLQQKYSSSLLISELRMYPYVQHGRGTVDISEFVSGPRYIPRFFDAPLFETPLGEARRRKGPSSLELLPMDREGFEQPLLILSEKADKQRSFSPLQFVKKSAQSLFNLIVVVSAFIIFELLGPALSISATQLCETINSVGLALTSSERERELVTRSVRNEDDCLPLYRKEATFCFFMRDPYQEQNRRRHRRHGSRRQMSCRTRLSHKAGDGMML